MGCDIYAYVEVKKEDGKWHWVYEGFEGFSWKIDVFDLSRNYDLFAILANVRNGYGFVGCDTGDGFNPIAMPKGMPSNCSKEVREKYDEWGGDAHSTSYLTLSELEAYDWKQVTKERGIVDQYEYKTFKETGKPEVWAGGVFGNAVRIISNKEMDERIAKKRRSKKYDYYTKIEWKETYEEVAGREIKEVMRRMRYLSNSEKKDDVRLIFWFDN